MNEINESTADRIRQHVLEKYIIPARKIGDQSLSVRVRDVHDALSLNQAWANVCQAISGPKFQSLASVAAPTREGPDASSTVIFTFDLRVAQFLMADVEQELTRRFGAPVKSVQKILAFQLPDGA